MCGLTNPADAGFAAEAGADLLGFVVHPPSPRHCANLVEASREAGDRAVLVMVADEADLLARTAEGARICRIQPHVPPRLRVRIAAALQTRGFELILPWPDEGGQDAYSGGLFLWEASPAHTGVAGGSGQVHGMAYPPPGPYLLAGGLSGANLAERFAAVPALALDHLRGFDAASALEREPGLKDPAKIRSFIRAARALEMPEIPHLENREPRTDN